MAITLGDKVKDPTTDWTGIADCRVTYQQGCDRIGIQAPVYTDKDGCPQVPGLFYVDEPQLLVVKKAVKKTVKKTAKPGGPSFIGVSTKPRI